MDSSESPLEEFHRSLSSLADECLAHIIELRRLGTKDDAVISKSRADTLSSDQVEVHRRLRASLWREDPDSPVTAGKDILDAMDDSNFMSRFSDVKIAIIKCRELAGYGSDTRVCHDALDVLEHEIDVMHSRLRDRLFSWPRSSLWGETASVMNMIRLLHDRKLHKLVAHASQPDPDFISKPSKGPEELKKAVPSPIENAGALEVTPLDTPPFSWNQIDWQLFIGGVPFAIPRSAKRLAEVFDALQSARWPKELPVKRMNRGPWREALKQFKKRNLPLKLVYSSHKILLCGSHRTPESPAELPPK